jgi:hypothetical protein
MQEFIGRPPIPFAILSHAWDSEEVNFQAFNNIATRTALKGWTKIEQTCREAQRCGFDYIWIDSACIDKTDNVELSESINSMFQWYNDAELCLVYLNDFDASTTAIDRVEILRRARWFSRGWTLQEIVAARAANFYDGTWRHFGTRASLRDELASITNIDASIFTPPRDHDAVDIRDLLDAMPVGRRMAWAASRQTTRPEDMAYCLIGLFRVSMPMLYGEGGEQAFIRLQEEIMRDSNDLSLFAWRARDLSTHRGILARSPDEFAGLSRLELEQDIKFNPEFSMSNKGLRINTFLKIYGITYPDVIMPLHCYDKGTRGEKMPQQLGVFLKHEGVSVYVRVRPDKFSVLKGPIPVSSGNSIFISKRVRRADTTALSAEHANAVSKNPCAVYFTIPGINAADPSPHVRPQPPRRYLSAQLLEVEPKELWDAQHHAFLTRGLRTFTAFLKFHIEDKDTVGRAVVACGFSDNISPWAMIGGESTELFQAAVRRGFHVIAEMGASRGRMGKQEQKLDGTHSSSNRNVKATLQCDQLVQNKEIKLFLSLGFYVGSSFSSMF